MARFERTLAARRDIVAILEWTDLNLGSAARKRYRSLLEAGQREIARHPLRNGSKSRSELGSNMRSAHLGALLPRSRSQRERVKAPRHVLFYVYLPDLDLVQLVRVLH